MYGFCFPISPGLEQQLNNTLATQRSRAKMHLIQHDTLLHVAPIQADMHLRKNTTSQTS